MNGNPDEGAHERARTDLAVQLERFPVAVNLLRRALFRQHLMLNVSYATPLLGIVSRMEGIDFAEAAWFIALPRGWPERPLATDARITSHGIERDFSFSRSQVWRRHRLAGTVVRTTLRSDDMIGMRVLSDGMELTVIDGALRIETYHGLGRVLLDHAVPATIANAAIGRPIDSLIDHRWLARTRWPVLRIDEGENRTSIIFETGRDPWSMPWSVYGNLDMGGRTRD
ncbi:hypothetical protein M9978_17500 [Sphingomonas sp. MG17]|uniref:DUF4166 domain-containing protein n=1 Tax=Sphingomonas tagetis TaxID=2949092 RepID=A0A9X2KM48_9SPHN|nr:hypothetical protein [Sphingomonas tagetis]MCP3732219.1 hypothetical protein [Sphingomonas tagetis]